MSSFILPTGGPAPSGDLQQDLVTFRHRPHLAPTAVRASVSVTNVGAVPAEWPVLLFARPPTQGEFLHMQERGQTVPVVAKAGSLVLWATNTWHVSCP